VYFTYFTNWIIISTVTRCLVCVSQNCEKRRTKYRRTRTALNNVIAETSLPVTQFDTSFETLINTRQRAIDDIVQDALQQHGYWRVCSFIVCFSVVYSRYKFHFISSFHLYHSVYFTDLFAFNWTLMPHWYANFPTDNYHVSLHIFTLHPSLLILHSHSIYIMQ